MRDTMPHHPLHTRPPRPWPRLRAVLLALLAAPLLAACGDGPLPALLGGAEETYDAEDTYPFTTGGWVIHWTGSTTIRVDVPDCSITGCPGDNSFEQAVRDGISAWNGVHSDLGIDIVFQNEGADPVDGDGNPEEVQVQWDDGSGVGSGVLGFAAVDTSENTSRYIVMTTRCNVCAGFPSHDPSTVRAVAMHEWGHMLGIWSHSFDEVDLMYPFFLGQTGFSARDEATGRKAYQFSPDLNLSALPDNPFTGANASSDGHLRIECAYGYPLTEADGLHLQTSGGLEP